MKAAWSSRKPLPSPSSQPSEECARDGSLPAAEPRLSCHLKSESASRTCRSKSMPPCTQRIYVRPARARKGTRVRPFNWGAEESRGPGSDSRLYAEPGQSRTGQPTHEQSSCRRPARSVFVPARQYPVLSVVLHLLFGRISRLVLHARLLRCVCRPPPAPYRA